MPKKIKDRFIDPVKEYSKPSSLEVKINGDGEFAILESVMHKLFEALYFKRVKTEVLENCTIFTYQPKGRKKNAD